MHFLFYVFIDLLFFHLCIVSSLIFLFLEIELQLAIHKRGVRGRAHCGRSCREIACLRRRSIIINFNVCQFFFDNMLSKSINILHEDFEHSIHDKIPFIVVNRQLEFIVYAFLKTHIVFYVNVYILVLLPYVALTFRNLIDTFICAFNFKD
jgi:hypothetical protein